MATVLEKQSSELSQTVKVKLFVYRPKSKKGEHKTRFKTSQGNRGNEAYKELVRQEREWLAKNTKVVV